MMKPRMTRIAVAFATVAISLQLSAQEEHAKHHHDKLFDLQPGSIAGSIS
jgi:hypothetical protein